MKNKQQQLVMDKACIMVAHSNGNKIMIRSLCGFDGKWHDDDDPSWNWAEYDYKIKPEEKKPKYIPYTRECLDNMAERGRIVINKTTDMRYVITGWSKDFVIINNNNMSYEDVLERYVHQITGDPFGREVMQ